MHKIQQWKWPTVQKYPFFKLCHGSRLSAKPLLHFHFDRVGAPKPQPWQSCLKGERHPSRLKADSVHPQIKTAGEHLKLHVGKVWGVCAYFWVKSCSSVLWTQVEMLYATWGYEGEGVNHVDPYGQLPTRPGEFPRFSWCGECASATGMKVTMQTYEADNIAQYQHQSWVSESGLCGQIWSNGILFKQSCGM